MGNLICDVITYYGRSWYTVYTSVYDKIVIQNL